MKKQISIVIFLLCVSFSMLAQKSSEPNASSITVQRGITIFADDLVNDDGVWIFDFDDLGKLANDMNRNVIFLSSKYLDTDYDQSHFNNYRNFIQQSHSLGMKVYGMPVSSTHPYYEEQNWGEFILKIQDRHEAFALYSEHDFDGLYFDLEPWASDRYKDAKSIKDTDEMSAIISEYKDLITETRTWIDDQLWTPESDYFLAFAVHMKWHLWSSRTNTDPEYVLDDVTGGTCQEFCDAGATVVVPQLYESKETAPDWQNKYTWHWLNKYYASVNISGWPVNQRKLYFKPYNYFLFHLSAYHDNYSGINGGGLQALLTDETRIINLMRSTAVIVGPELPAEKTAPNFSTVYNLFYGTNLYGFEKAMEWLGKESNTKKTDSDE